ncbi:branched-chain amino acid ABC transporter permease [Streptomyces sp. B-S-A8]|uniref:Branched-chain amino acid ABC transporter permease n=1 Tax=Streptomyces solicavernae TaxID=3043614 RepID=A0ABT6RLS3_9ACTN|nr:branched-chain amino acid ABC transporter permease [Streptomyces sp. B-S-A8]MDI3385209.1 branched-chain amino acid ABC transporter permease [Streptomyces sp. B-S-A8]
MGHQRLFTAALALVLTVGPAASAGATAPGRGEAGDAGPGFGARALQALLDGVQFGVIIAITAVGLSLIFGTIHLINFAHGELVTIGAVSAFFLNASASGPGWHLIPAALAAVLLGGLVGAAVDLGVWRPLRRRGTGLINLFIVTIGLSLLLRHVVLVLYGTRPGSYVQYDIQQTIELGPVGITPRDLTVTVLSVLTLLGVALLLQRTRTGTAIRAVAGNRDLAAASGIDVQRVVLVVWILAGALAALGGVFFGLVEIVTWDMGYKLLLLMFAGVILGGLGSAYGAMAGSLVIGVVAQMSTLWFPVDLQYAWALLALVLVLLVRPQGILGRRERVG